MNLDNYMDSKILLIHGPMGSGKSTVCKYLQEEILDYHFLDRAKIKNQELSNMKDRDIARKISKEKIYQQIESLLEQQANILLQEFHRHQIIDRFSEQIRMNDYDLVSFYLYCSVETAKKRDLERQNKYVRPEVVEEKHSEYRGPDPADIPINTEINDLEQTISLIKWVLK